MYFFFKFEAQSGQPGGSQVLTGAKWHIPQNGDNSGAENGAPNNNSIIRTQLLQGSNDNFKIMLRAQNVDMKPTAVSSTIPKTPSPKPNSKTDAENLDKYCQDSVNDLMATIGKTNTFCAHTNHLLKRKLDKEVYKKSFVFSQIGLEWRSGSGWRSFENGQLSACGQLHGWPDGFHHSGQEWYGWDCQRWP